MSKNNHAAIMNLQPILQIILARKSIIIQSVELQELGV